MHALPAERRPDAHAVRLEGRRRCPPRPEGHRRVPGRCEVQEGRREVVQRHDLPHDAARLVAAREALRRAQDQRNADAVLVAAAPVLI